MFVVGFIVVSFGFLGLLVNKNNLVLYFMALELLLLGVNVLFIGGSLFLGDVFGIICGFYVLTVAACEISVGLGLLVSYYISQLDVSVLFFRLLRW